MRRASPAIVCVVTSMVSAMASPVLAAEKDPKKEAIKLIGLGDKAFKKGDYAGALARYQAAYQVFPSPKIFYAMAKAEEQLARPLDAIAHFEQFLTEAGNDVNEDLRVDAQVSVQELDKTIAVLTLAVEPDSVTITVDDVEIGVSPLDRPVRLMPGAHKLGFVKNGFRPIERTVELAVGERPVEKITLAPDRAPEPAIIERAPVAARAPDGQGSSAVLWTGVGVTSALTVGWLVTGALAISDHGHYGDVTRDPDDRASARDRGKTLALTSDILLVGALAAGSFTTWYYLKVYALAPAPSDREAAMDRVIVPYVAPSGAGVAFMGSF